MQWILTHWVSTLSHANQESISTLTDASNSIQWAYKNLGPTRNKCKSQNISNEFAKCQKVSNVNLFYTPRCSNNPLPIRKHVNTDRCSSENRHTSIHHSCISLTYSSKTFIQLSDRPSMWTNLTSTSQRVHNERTTNIQTDYHFEHLNTACPY